MAVSCARAGHQWLNQPPEGKKKEREARVSTCGREESDERMS